MMIMENNIKNIDTEELIAGYFAHELNERETKLLCDWINASVENKKYFEQQREVWFSAIASDKHVRFDKQKAFQLFLSRKSAASQKISYSKKRLAIIVQRIAAAAAILIIFAGSGYWLGIGRVKGLIAEHVVVEAPLGSRSKMYLPDGTLVWLNAGSTLSYSQNFGVEDRTVNLKGEGYFEVSHNEKKPFYVISNDLKIRVLGTKFNLRNYIEEEEARVTLVEGSIKANTKTGVKKEAYLRPNQQMIFDKINMTARVVSTKASNAFEWTNGYIFFDEERLPDIARELERSYNVKINIADESLNSYRFYGNFTRTEQTIQEVLEVLASTGKLRYDITGKEITLKLN